ncbi:efflux RND transporter periplasmic adaptor subunit [Pseudorhodoferax soli]|uniref:CusB/HlyD membrane fusion family barrel-sandwich protein n=1 Tax=Pseudorhodoferax soli TaxID=545864 RepID=A0A368XDK9_9BURK|nr:efflux RND transporter periplasmic adaptor subunit [Pseudorhodoferax soli]PZP91292.1 MAG: RND transporter [Variovorax paradoxus]PZQ01094.1 MAG: RND transporter [Variovorax paradoxus]RCW66061.1 CusB/HlyD membrane fusion family barrel-sandwich protein [Pseudorhodoferax soli]
MFSVPLPAPLARAAITLAFLALAPGVRAADDFKISPAQIQALGIQLARLEKPSDIGGQAYPARVVLPPAQESVLSAPLAGSIDQLLVAENQAVKAGQPLVRLVSPELGELQLRLAEAASRARLAQQALAREQALLADGIIAERRVQESSAAAAEARIRQTQAEGALRLAGADAGLIRRIADGGAMQDSLVLRARSSGTVTRIDAKPGQRVQAAEALLRTADTSKLWLDVQVPVDRRASIARPGASLTGVDRGIQAKTIGFGPTVSESQTVTLRAEVTQGVDSLRVGEALQVRVPFSAAQAWAVPVPAVVRQDDKAYVFVRTADGFMATQVAIQASAGQSLLVSGPLKPSQEVAVSSVIALKAAWLGKGGSN